MFSAINIRFAKGSFFCVGFTWKLPVLRLLSIADAESSLKRKKEKHFLSKHVLNFQYWINRFVFEKKSVIIELQRTRDITMCNNINSHELSSEIQVSATCNSCESEEKLSYANVVKFGEEREQPVIKHSKVTVSRFKDTRKSKPIRNKQTEKEKSKACEVYSKIEEDCKPSNTLQTEREYCEPVVWTGARNYITIDSVC